VRDPHNQPRFTSESWSKKTTSLRLPPGGGIFKDGGPRASRNFLRLAEAPDPYVSGLVG
jgi:hypothetical protein